MYITSYYKQVIKALYISSAAEAPIRFEDYLLSAVFTWITCHKLQTGIPNITCCLYPQFGSEEKILIQY